VLTVKHGRPNLSDVYNDYHWIRQYNTGSRFIKLKVPAQGRIKGFVGRRHFSSLGTFVDLTSSVGTRVYSRLSGLMEVEGMHG
jgi:hypothetical protein